MNLGRVIRTVTVTREDDRRAIPITLPERKEDAEKPIPVPNWPVRKSTPVKVPAESEN